MTHDQIAELLGAYALDAVEADEAALIGAHLLECPRCAAELAQHREVAALLANAGSDAPDELWDKIVSRLDPPGDPPSTETVLRAALADPLPRPISLRQRRTRWSTAAVVGAIAAAVIALLAIQVNHLDNRVNHPSVTDAAQAALRNPQAHTVTLTATAHGQKPAADVVVLPSGSGYVINQRLQPLPGDQTYQLWGVEQGRTISLGLLGSHPTEVAFSQGQGTPITFYAVTAERAGGVVASHHMPVAESRLLSA
jgi:hypothetical protein